MTDVISGIEISDSAIAREAAELVRQHETEMLFNHSLRIAEPPLPPHRGNGDQPRSLVGVFLPD
jgi:hypothetical protein